MKHCKTGLVIIFWAALLGYANSFSGSFVFDDRPTIVHSPLTPAKNIKQIFAAAPKRFFPNLSFVLNYKIGGENVTGYHLVNFTLHLAMAFTVYWFVALLLEAA